MGLRFSQLWMIAGKVYDELMYQGYAATRLTGVNLSAKKASSVLRNAKTYKYLMTGIYGSVIAATLALGLMFKVEEKGIAVTLFFWVYVLVFMSAFQVSFSVSSSPHIRDLLMTLPISGSDAQAISALSIVRSVDAPLAVSLVLPALIGLLAGPVLALNYLMASLMGASLALLTDVLLSSGFRKVTVGGKASGLLRAFSIVPVVILASVAYDVPVFISQHWSPLFSYLPLLDLYWVDPRGVLSSVLYTTLFVAVAYWGFSKQAIYLLTPEEYVGSAFRGQLEFKLHSQTFSVISLDFRQAMRSRLAGILVVPFLYVVMALVVAFTSGNAVARDFSVFYFSFAVPMAFAASMLGYALYASEARGQAAFRLLPISKLRNMMSKALVSVGTYAVGSVFLSALFAYFGGLAYSIPVLMTSFPVFSAVVFAAVYFDRVYSGGGAGMANPATAALYALGVLLVMGIPIGSYLTLAYAGKGPLLSSVLMAAISLIEASFFMFLLRK